MTRGEWMDGWSGRKIDSLSRVPGHTQFSSVHTEARRARKANTRTRGGAQAQKRRNGSSLVREQHGNKLYCGNALDRIRCTPLRVWRVEGEGRVKGEGGASVPELNKPG